MPELPDIEVYCRAIGERTVGTRLNAIKVFSPSVLKTFDPPASALLGKEVDSVDRIGKRVAIKLKGGYAAIVHLMIAGRFTWAEGSPKTLRPGGKACLAYFQFEKGHLVLTEAATRHMASIHLVSSVQSLAELDPGGLEPLVATPEQFATAMRGRNRTLKRALTDPRTISGIGNSYSDEILFRAKLSPFKLTGQMTDEEYRDLLAVIQATLTEWRDRLLAETKGQFPGRNQVTAFRPDFAVHGRYGLPCPVCGKPVQRIRYESNETNYCGVCQVEGRLLADRSLSRLLKSDWPKTVEELIGE